MMGLEDCPVCSSSGDEGWHPNATPIIIKMNTCFITVVGIFLNCLLPTLEAVEIYFFKNVIHRFSLTPMLRGDENR